jgi:hypothetical protein
MLTRLVVFARSLALICAEHRAVALENRALRQRLAVFKRTTERPTRAPARVWRRSVSRKRQALSVGISRTGTNSEKPRRLGRIRCVRERHG